MHHSYSQPGITTGYIYYQRFLRIFKTAGLLHVISLIGGSLSIGCGRLALVEMLNSGFHGSWVMYLFFAVYGLVLIFFSQMDAKSRFQNYKQAKDLLYENGFQTRIIRLFCASRCQRDALRVAAADLGMLQELDAHYNMLGYRWFHVIPDFVFSRPTVFFTPRYWQRTLFEKPYQLKYFLW